MRAPETRREVAAIIAVAALISFLLEAAAEAAVGTLDGGVLVARALLYPVAVGFFWVVGWWLGTRTWPRRGAALLRRMLRRRLRDQREFLFVSDRPDRQLPLHRRVWEVVGFSAGLTLLVTGTLLLLGAPPRVVLVLATLLPGITLWASFLLVPYWLFSRLGIRVVDVLRWLVLPLSRRYADRLKLSNGALVLLGIGATVNATLRAGASGGDAVAGALITALRIVATVLIVAAAAVAYYLKGERALAHELEREAIQMGIRDGRGMSDGEFLPRLPAPAPKAEA